MDPLNQTQPSQQPPVQPLQPTQPTSVKSAGPIIGIIIIIIVLIVGALYFYGAQLNQSPAPVTPTTGMEAETSPLSVSDEIDAISADLSATVINSIDADIGQIDAQINQ